jgi:hypothetical protein
MRPIFTEHPNYLVDRHAPGRFLAKPSVNQPRKAILLKAPPVTPELSLRNPEYLSSLQRGEPAGNTGKDQQARGHQQRTNPS